VNNTAYKQLTDTTVQVRVYSPGIENITNVGFAYGTGWIVHNNNGRTFIWTAGHVVTAAKVGDSWGKVVLCDRQKAGEGYNDDIQEAKILRVSFKEDDTTEDLALLTIETQRYKKSSKFLDSETHYPRLGDKLLLAGCTNGPFCGVFITEGTLGKNDIKIGNFFYDYCSIPGGKGSSGGPVTDRHGNVVGALMAGYGECHGYFTPSKRIRAWAEKMNVQYALYPSMPVPVDMGYVEDLDASNQTEKVINQ
jgi:hypothetical protein